MVTSTLPDLLPGGAGRPGAFHSIYAGPGILEAESLATTDFTKILNYIQDLRDAGCNVPRTVRLGPHRYTVGNGTAWSFTGVCFEGVVGTEIVFKGKLPAKVTKPSIVGFPALREVETACLGFMIRGDRIPIARGITFKNIIFRGLISTASVSGHYDLISIVSDNVEFENCKWTNEHSEISDLDDLTPYNPLFRRNILSLCLVNIGEDRWMEPNPERIRPCRRPRFANCEFNGEPLGWAPGGSPLLIGVRIRRGSNPYWSNNSFGVYDSPEESVITDIQFTANPVDGDILQINCWDPYLLQGFPLFIFFKDTPTTIFHCQRGLTKEATALNLVNAINKNKITNTGFGAFFVEALAPSQYLIGGIDGTHPVVRVRSLNVGSAVPFDKQGHQFVTWVPQSSAFCSYASGGANPFSFHNIADTHERAGYWKYGLITEDTFRGYIGPTDCGTDIFTGSAYLDVATEPHLDFVPNSWSEAGHKIITGWQGERTAGGRAIINIRSGAFLTVKDIEFGQAVVAAPGTTVPAIKVEPGTNSVWPVLLQGGLPADGAKLTIADGMGHTKVFEYDSNGVVGGGNIPVPIGVTAALTHTALRNAIQGQMDLKALYAFAEFDPDPNLLNITFFTPTEFSSTPSIVDSNDTGDKLLTLDNSKPYRPAFFSYDGTIHWPGSLDTGGYSVPYIWLEKFFGSATIRGEMQHLRKMDPSKSAQAFAGVVFTGNIPTNDSKLTIDSLADPAVDFVFKNVAVGESPTTKWVDTSSGVIATIIANFVSKVHSCYSGADQRSFDATNFNPIVNVLDGTPGVNANLVTETGDAANAWVITSFSGGSASTTDQGERAPIVIKDVPMWSVDVHASPFANGVYVGPNNPPDFALSFDNFAYESTYGGGPRQLVFASKSSVGFLSKGVIRGVQHGVFGRARHGKTRAFDVGGFMDPNDIKVDCLIDGEAVAG